MGRAGVDVGWRPIVDKAPVAQDQDAVENGFQSVGFMEDNDHRGCESPEGPSYLGLVVDVYAGKRLIHHDETRPVDDAPRNEDTLLLASGEVQIEFFGLISQADNLKGFHCELAVFRPDPPHATVG